MKKTLRNNNYLKSFVLFFQLLPFLFLLTAFSLPTRSALAAPPTITCPGYLYSIANIGFCNTSVAGLAAVTNDPDGDITTLTWTMTGVTVDASPAGGINNLANHLFNTGVTNVSYTVTDATGGTASCSFIVEIFDSEPPVITCPANVTVNISNCVTFATGVALGVPVASDNCGIQNITNDAPAQYPVGTTSVYWVAHDVNGLSSSSCLQLVKVIQSLPLLVNVSSTPVKCFGGADGTATATVTEGLAPYTYSWNTSPAQTTATASNLAAGSYTVSVTDASGCTATASVAVAQPAAVLSATTSQVNLVCFGQVNGSATAIPAGGNGPYTYSWNTAPVQTAITATGLSAGSYTVTVSDAGGCTATATATITAPAPLTATASQVPALCFGAFSGSAIALPAGGTAPYTYSWNTLPVQTTSTATNLAAGSYTVTVTDNAGCTTTTTVTVTEPVVLTATASQVNVLCFGQSTGSATAIPAGGTAPYTYSWNTATEQTTVTAVNLAAGTYIVTVTDAGGCTATASVTITEPATAVSATTIQTDVKCFGQTTGSATATPAGGTAPYTYSWNTSPAQLTATASNLAAGSYTATVTDANGCTTTAPVTIAEPAAVLSVTTSQVNVLCSGAATGSATAIPAGGTAAYTYSWNTAIPQTTATATNLAAGTYTVTVTDNGGCTATASVTITQPALLTATASQVPALCFGQPTGSATALPAGGTAPYTYSWNSAPLQSTATATNLAAGTYTVTVTDFGGCTTTASVTVAEPVVLAATASQVNVLCFGQATGSATALPAGGTAPYTYSWNTTPVQTTATASNLAAGTYTVTVTDAGGCFTTASVTLTQPATALTTTTTQVNVLCFGLLTGSATVTPAGGTAPYSYSWNTTPVQTTATASGLAAGTYTATVTDAAGCILPTSITITQPALLSATTSQVAALCFGAANGSATALPAGGTAPYAYLWNTSQTTDVISGLAAGVYTVTVTDNAGCTTTASVTVTEPVVLSATSSQVNVLCFGLATGSATALPAGGTAPYSYSWNTTPVQTTAIAANLAAGSYTVTVTDAGLCTTTASVIITEPATAVSTTTSQVNVLCFGQATGSATALPAGGTAPYTNSWNTTPVQLTATATSLAAGTYIVTVTDAGGCTTSASVTITQPATALTATTTQVNVLCFGQSTGSAIVTPVGGVAPYTYSWNTTPAQTTASVSALAAGSYTVTITDFAGCTTSSTVTIAQPAAALSTTTTQVNVLCFGQTTGSATVIPAGGTAPYMYAWNTTPVQSTDVIAGLAVGTYTVTVTDAAGCATTTSVTITQPAAALSTTASQVNVLCFAQATASATSIPAGGTAPYSYAWNTTPVQTTATATSLVAGTYSVTVTDAGGCTASASVIITQPLAGLSTTTSQVNVLCFGLSTGSATVTAAGGTAPYSYSWNTTPVQTTAAASGLAAGIYTVTVTDAVGCTLATPVAVTQPAAVLSATTTTVNVLCFGLATGSATAIPAGGTAPYTYAWNTTPVQTTATAAGLAAGAYSVTITDAGGCTTTAGVTIIQPALLLATIASHTDILCFGKTDATATPAVTGGTLPYTYAWNTVPVQTTAIAANLAAGTYILTVTDAGGCTTTTTVTVTQPASAITAPVTAKVNVACFGNTTGSVTVAAGGGTPSYQYSLNGGTYQVSGTFATLAAGNYTVTAKDANGCSLDVAVTITQPAAALSATTGSLINVACSGQLNGSSTGIVTGGTLPYTYAWNTVPVQTTATAANLAAGTYTVTVTDAASCTTTAAATITQPAALLATITSQTTEDCAGSANGTVVMAASGGTPAYQFSLNGGTYQSGATFSNLGAGNYTVTLQDAHNCTFNAAVTIGLLGQPLATNDNVVTNEDTPVSGNLFANDRGFCFPPVNMTSNTPTTKGTLVILPSGTFTYTPALNYNGTDFFSYTITDSRGNNSTALVFITINAVNDRPVAVDDKDTAIYNKPVTINILANDSDVENGVLTVSLCGSPSNGTIVINADQTVTYTPYTDFTGNDAFCYTICDDGTPSLCDSATVRIYVKPSIKVYHGISPNGDGNNDNLVIRGIEDFPDNNLQVFNRNGDMIRELSHYDNHTVFWDGTNKNGNPVPEGTYFYILKIKDATTLTGWVFIRGKK